jgi:hypothetical protein
MHEDLEEEALALCMSSKEHLPSIISWRAFILEEGASHLLTGSFLERVLAIRTERYQLQIDHSSRTAIPVEGIHHLTSQLHFGADLAVWRRGAPHFPSSCSLSLIASPSGVAIVPGSLLYCIYCFRSLLFRYIHHIPKLVFPRGGFIQGLRPKIPVSTHAF